MYGVRYLRTPFFAPIYEDSDVIVAAGTKQRKEVNGMTEEFYAALGKILIGVAKYLCAPLLVTMTASIWTSRLQRLHPQDKKKRRPIKSRHKQ